MHLRGFNDDYTTFGMAIENSPAFRNFRKNIRYEEVTDIHGLYKRRVRVCPAKFVAAMMKDAGWLVSEREDFFKIQIEGSTSVGGDIYIEYASGIRMK